MKHISGSEEGPASVGLSPPVREAQQYCTSDIPTLGIWIGIGHFRESLRLGTPGRLWGWRDNLGSGSRGWDPGKSLGWALQGDFGVGHSRADSHWASGVGTPGRLWGTPVSGLGAPGHLRETLGLGSPGRLCGWALQEFAGVKGVFWGWALQGV